MAIVNPYLMFEDNCKEAFEFYKNAFEKEYSDINYFGDMPPQEGVPPLSHEQKQMVMHVKLPISAETVLYGSDIFPGTSGFSIGDQFSVSITADSREEADALFTKLSEGGKVTMPLADTFWGAYFGMWRDKFGVDWMINFDEPRKFSHLFDQNILIDVRSKTFFASNKNRSRYPLYLFLFSFKKRKRMPFLSGLISLSCN